MRAPGMPEPRRNSFQGEGCAIRTFPGIPRCSDEDYSSPRRRDFSLHMFRRSPPHLSEPRRCGLQLCLPSVIRMGPEELAAHWIA
eukprot:16441165-Heterocapsa_arctica.AAC.1